MDKYLLNCQQFCVGVTQNSYTYTLGNEPNPSWSATTIKRVTVQTLYRNKLFLVALVHRQKTYTKKDVTSVIDNIKLFFSTKSYYKSHFIN